MPESSVCLHDGEFFFWGDCGRDGDPCGVHTVQPIASGYCPDDVTMLVMYGACSALECHGVAGLIDEAYGDQGDANVRCVQYIL